MCGVAPKAVGPAFAGDNGAAWTEIPQRTTKPAQIAMMRTITLHCFSAAYDSKKPSLSTAPRCGTQSISRRVMPLVATDIDAGAMSSGRDVLGAWRNSEASAIR
jgi:hypothetical protein